MTNTNEIEKWRQAVGMPEAEKGASFDDIQGVNELFEQHSKLLDEDEVDGRECRVIPEFTFDHHDETGRTTGKAFFLRPTKLRAGNGPFNEREEPFIYAHIQPNVMSPEKYALSLDILRGTIAYMGNEVVDLDDPVITSVLGAACQQAEIVVDALEATRQETVRSRVRRVGASAAVLAVIGGAAFGVKAWIDKKAHDREEAAKRVETFDASGYTIESGVFELSDGAIARVTQAEFQRIPSYHRGDNLRSARKIKVDEETCKTISTQVPADGKVHVAASETDPFQVEPLAIARNNKGELIVCSLQAFGDSEENTREIAVQIR